MKTARFPIGTQYKPLGKDYVCTVVDIHTTYDHKGDFVKLRYVSTHKFMGQTVTNRDVVETTIARGVWAT